jgi:hypothetical protein
MQQPRPHTLPLSPGARLLRGFKRIGLALALPIVIIGCAASVILSFTSARDSVGRYDQLRCMTGKSRASLFVSYQSQHDGFKYYDPEKSGCPGSGSSFSENELAGFPDQHRPSFVTDFVAWSAGGIAGTVALASIIYGLFWTLGWIAAGFSRD